MTPSTTSLDTAGLPSIVCLECMPNFRAGGALGRPGQPGVNFAGSQQPKGLTPHEWGFAKKL
eukprot:1146145-Pelagomonas_calceolata.AAC.5